MIISLWEVSDIETAELMKEFYKEITDGATIYKALRKAQIKMKNRYKDPCKWAGFILLGE